MVQNTNLAPTKIISEAENIENSLVDDLSITCSDFRYIAPIIILISVFFGYHMTIIPHNVNLIRKIVVDQSNLVKMSSWGVWCHFLNGFDAGICTSTHVNFRSSYGEAKYFRCRRIYVDGCGGCELTFFLDRNWISASLSKPWFCFIAISVFHRQTWNSNTSRFILWRCHVWNHFRKLTQDTGLQRTTIRWVNKLTDVWCFPVYFPEWPGHFTIAAWSVDNVATAYSPDESVMLIRFEKKFPSYDSFADLQDLISLVGRKTVMLFTSRIQTYSNRVNLAVTNCNPGNVSVKISCVLPENFVNFT